MIIAPLVRRMFRISPKGDQIVSVQGHKMLFGVASEAHLDMSECTWEPGVVTLLKKRLSLGMTFVDLGAHIGFFTLMAAKQVGQGGSVYAFEPAPENFELLTKNISLNGYSNVSPIQMAVSNAEGFTTLYLNPYSVAHSLHQDTFGKSREELRIEVTTLDSYFERLEWPPVNVVKMDIEGAEPNAFMGMKGLIGKNPDLVLVDTAVVARSPARLLVAGMGDALATLFEAQTCVEGFVKNMRGGGSTQSALALAELCYRILVSDGAQARLAVETQSVTPALERIIEANTLLSGLGFESSGLAAAHAIHNGLTAAPATHRFLHGEKVAFGTLVQLVLEGKERSVVDEVLRFSTEVGLPTTLSEIGLEQLEPELLGQISLRATAEGETIHNEPFMVTSDMVSDAIMTADAVGRAWKGTRIEKVKSL